MEQLIPKDNNPPKWHAVFVISCFSLAFVLYTFLLIVEGFNWLRLLTALSCALVLILFIRKQRREKVRETASEEG
jgi:hypothetical protein